MTLASVCTNFLCGLSDISCTHAFRFIHSCILAHLCFSLSFFWFPDSLSLSLIAEFSLSLSLGCSLLLNIYTCFLWHSSDPLWDASLGCLSIHKKGGCFGPAFLKNKEWQECVRASASFLIVEVRPPSILLALLFFTASELQGDKTKEGEEWVRQGRFQERIVEERERVRRRKRF